MKPHEETWQVDTSADWGAGIEISGESESSIGSFMDSRDAGCPEELHRDESIARAILAAQAPAMARLLLRLHRMENLFPDGDGMHEREIAILLRDAEVLP